MNTGVLDLRPLAMSRYGEESMPENTERTLGSLNDSSSKFQMMAKSV